MPETISSGKCPMCEVPIGTVAKFCANCGMSLRTGISQAAGKPRWYHNVWFVLFLLFFVLGPFALPLVWKNPKFPKTVKITLTVVMAILCFVIVQLVIHLYSVVSYHLEQFDATMGF